MLKIELDEDKLKSCDKIEVDKDTLKVTYLYEYMCIDCAAVEYSQSQKACYCSGCMPC